MLKIFDENDSLLLPAATIRSSAQATPVMALTCALSWPKGSRSSDGMQFGTDGLNWFFLGGAGDFNVGHFRFLDVFCSQVLPVEDRTDQARITTKRVSLRADLTRLIQVQSDYNCTVAPSSDISTTFLQT